MARVLGDYPNVSVEPGELDGRIDFERIFGRTGPVHIEVGCGKGTFLVNQGQAEVGVNFLGIEWANKYYRYAVDRIGRRGLPNVRVIRTDAAVFIAENIEDESADCFHIYFPDPWPKKRHHKRRFLNIAKTEQLIRCLKPAGTIRIATDHAGYFEQIEDVLGGFEEQLGQIDFETTADAQKGEWVGTNFERKYLKENRDIYTMAAEKISKG